MEAWEQKKLEHKEAKRAQHAEMLRPMVWQLVTLAERSIHYCQSLDAAAVPKSTWKDWAQAFVQGCLDDEEAAAAEAAAAEKSAAATQLVTTPADKAAALVCAPNMRLYDKDVMRTKTLRGSRHGSCCCSPSPPS